MSSLTTEPHDAALEGIQLCRRGDWRLGYDQLRRVAAVAGRQDMPSLFYSYLGFCIARFDRRYRDGITLAKHAVQKEFFQPDNYLNLGKIYLLVENRKGAHEAVAKGLAMDAQHAGLQALRQELGVRRAPVLSFLDRANPVNQLLGRIRHSLKPQVDVDDEPTPQQVADSLDRTIHM
jgi:hypothetical protein